MMAIQGFSGWRLGLCTRSVFSGGRRMAFALPDIVTLGPEYFFGLFGKGKKRRRSNCEANARPGCRCSFARDDFLAGY